MGKLGETVKTFNSTVRTLILAAVAGVIGVSAYFAYSEYSKQDRLVRDQAEQLTSLKEELVGKDSEIRQLGIDLQQKDLEIEKLETAMKLLKTDQRLARLKVLSVETDEEGQAITSRLEFVELSPTGEPLSQPKQFELPGDLVYVDNWVVKFDDQYIENGDVERGTSLVLFRRIFSEQQMPSQGLPLDEIGMRPQAYARGGALSEFERQLWAEFWEFANDPVKAAESGIRAANGEAVSIKVREGMTYMIELRASGGLSIQPVASTDTNQAG